MSETRLPDGALMAQKDAPVGGQAVLEGVMMRGVSTWAVAVRKPLPEQLVCAGPDPEDQHAGSEMWRTLESFLDTLDDQRRAVFVSSLIEQLPAAETAAATGVDVARVYH